MKWGSISTHYYYRYFSNIGQRPFYEKIEGIIVVSIVRIFPFYMILFKGICNYFDCRFLCLMCVFCYFVFCIFCTFLCHFQQTKNIPKKSTCKAPQNKTQKKGDLRFLWYYYLPFKFATVFLSMTFDYLPHRPHSSLDIYEGTSVTSIYGNTKDTAFIQPLTLLLLYQNYHNIHHLYPWIPFYHYSTVNISPRCVCINGNREATVTGAKFCG